MDSYFYEIIKEREEISVRYDPDTAALWCYFNPKIRPCYTLKLLDEIREFQLALVDYFEYSKTNLDLDIRFLIVSSQTPNVFNYGGDLNLFSQLIEERNLDKLVLYGKKCIDIAYAHHTSYDLPITTISLIQGDALGGGLETGLSSNIIIAEEDVKLGFPEIRFNLFPGMGAFTFLSRTIGIQKSEEVIGSGKSYTAKELHALGAITHLSKKGCGEKDLERILKQHNKFFYGMNGIQKTKQRALNIQYDELMDIVKIWAKTALQIEKKDIRMMQKLVQSQNIKLSNLDRMRTKQDRRFFKPLQPFPIKDSQGNVIEYDRRRGVDRRKCS